MRLKVEDYAVLHFFFFTFSTLRKGFHEDCVTGRHDFSPISCGTKSRINEKNFYPLLWTRVNTIVTRVSTFFTIYIESAPVHQDADHRRRSGEASDAIVKSVLRVI